MENRGYSIYEVGILGGNDKDEIKFILFLMFCDRMELDSYAVDGGGLVEGYDYGCKQWYWS